MSLTTPAEQARVALLEWAQKAALDRPLLVIPGPATAYSHQDYTPMKVEIWPQDIAELLAPNPVLFNRMAYTALKPLNIDDAARARAKELRNYALERRVSMTEARAQDRSGMPMKDAEKLTMQVPVGYNIAYSIEQRSEGWFQRISVFQATPRIEPAPTAVARILEELFDIHATRRPVEGRGGSVLDEALEVEPQNLGNGCIAISLLYRFKWPGHEGPAR